MPESYQSPMRKDAKSEDTHSQTLATNMATEAAKVHKILDLKGKTVFSIGPDETLHTAVTLLRDHKVGALIVTDASGKLVGILSERDVVRKLAETPGTTLPQKVADVMTRDVETCASDDTLESVLRRMTNGRFRHMPVDNGLGLEGMISIGDVVNYRLKQLEHEALQLKQLIVG